MKKKVILLLVIATMLAAGYVAWDQSFRDEITEQDIERAEEHLQWFDYGTNNLQVFNVYDKYGHAKYIYAQSDSAFALFYKNNGEFISAGQGGRFTGYLSGDYKLYLFPPFGYYAGPADMSYKAAKEQGLLHDIHQEDQDVLWMQMVSGNTYIWEKEGFGGDFTITLNEDGTYEYYVGYLSSYIGLGNWSLEGDKLTMTETTGFDRVFHFTVEDEKLIFVLEGSSEFGHVKVEDGDCFIREKSPDMPAIYQNFLNGEALLERASVLPLQKYRKPYTLKELRDGWQNRLAAQTSYDPQAETDIGINYALVDCMEDGDPELALRFLYSDGLNGYAEHCILKESGGVLREVANWDDRSEVNPYGFSKRFYSMNDWETEIDYGYIQTNLGPYGGKELPVYEETQISGLPQPCIPALYFFVDLSDLPEGYPEDTELLNANGPYTLHVYYLGNPYGDWPTEPFYAFTRTVNGKEQPVEPLGTFVEWYRSAGIDVCTQEESEERIDACYEAFGLSPEHRSDRSIKWNPWNPL